MLEGWICWQYFFHHDLVLPAVAEIIFVNKLFLHGRREVGDLESFLIQGFVAHISRVRVGPPVESASHDELVQMRVRPAHHHLNDLMQPVQGHVPPHDHAPPNRRLGPSQSDLQLIQRHTTASFEFGYAFHKVQYRIISN